MWMLGFADTSKNKPKDPNDPDADLEEEEDEDEGSSAVGGAMLDLAPWAISALTHVALVLLAIWMVWWSITKTVDEEIIIPSTNLSEKPGAPLSMKTMKKMKRSSSKRRSVTKVQTKTVSNVISKIKTTTRLIGVAGAAAGKSSPFGAAMGSDGPFASSLYGSGGNARRIAYVIDASGSLIDSLPFVVMELKRSINSLSEGQSFTVIFFMGGVAKEVPPFGLQKAVPTIKLSSMKWIDPSSGHVVPHGKTNPLEAVKKALRYRPQLLYILSDNITGRGQFELDQATILESVRKSNVGNTKINTIQFLYPDPLTKIGMQPTLKKISEDSGGIYKFVDRRALGLE
jgi:hypothetical protein